MYTMKMLAPAGILVLLGALNVDAYGSGAPKSACGHMTPGHKTFSPQTSAVPYEVVPSKSCYTPGKSVEVKIKVKQNSLGVTDLGGVLVEARKASGATKQEQYGTWNALASQLQALDCGSAGSANAITHKSPTGKGEQTIKWTAPASSVLNEEVVFRFTAAQNKATYWTDQQSTTLKPCSASSPLTQSAAMLAVVIATTLTSFY